MMGYGDMAGYSWIWMTMGLAFWGVLLAFAIYAFTRQGNGARPSDPTSEDILRERFARGEIDATDYETRRGVLRK